MKYSIGFPKTILIKPCNLSTPGGDFSQNSVFSWTNVEDLIRQTLYDLKFNTPPPPKYFVKSVNKTNNFIFNALSETGEKI